MCSSDLADEMLRTGIGGVCSDSCLRLLKKKYSDKKARKALASSRSGSGWKTKVKKRDGGRCRFCGTTAMIQVHHIEYRSQGGSDEEHNLITLCLDHHSLVHSNKSYWQPMLRGVIWKHYSGTFLMIPDFVRMVEFGNL